MRGISKKMFISILTSVIVMVTMVATTFAWVGIFTYANTDNFNINLKVSELDSNYYLTISNTGKKGSFSDSIPTIDIERQIVNQKYNNKYKDNDDAVINYMFDKIYLHPSTTFIKDDNSFSNFEEINYNSGALSLKKSDGYYKFDIYLSVNTKEGITTETTGIRTNILLTNLENTLEGTIHQDILTDINPFLDMPSNPITDLLKKIPQTYSVNSKNACRVGFSLYNPINIDDEYSDLDLPVKSVIYQGGNQLPSYNDITEVYDLGGCLPEDQNTALQELLIIRPDYNKSSSDLYYSKLNTAINRGDLEINEENSLLWDKKQYSSYLGCMNGIQTKMKVTVYLWFEGWDADCLRHIEKQPVTLNLTFTSGIED